MMEEKITPEVVSGTNDKWNVSQKRGPREMYEWDDKEAKKYGLTQLQYNFVQEYLSNWWNATQAVRDARGWEIKNSDWVHGHHLKNNTRVMKYISDTAEECATIQMEQIIRNKKAPMAVRNDAIKDRLNRAGVWNQDDVEKPNMYVGNMTITIDK